MFGHYLDLNKWLKYSLSSVCLAEQDVQNTGELQTCKITYYIHKKILCTAVFASFGQWTNSTIISSQMQHRRQRAENRPEASNTWASSKTVKPSPKSDVFLWVPNPYPVLWPHHPWRSHGWETVWGYGRADGWVVNPTGAFHVPTKEAMHAPKLTTL